MVTVMPLRQSNADPSDQAFARDHAAGAEALDLAPVHLWRLAADGEPVFLNKRMIDFFGLDLAALPGVGRLAALIAATVYPDDALAFTETLKGCIADGTPFAAKHRCRRADGEVRWMSSRAEPLRDAHGRIAQWAGASFDIDEDVRAHEALRKREQELSILIDMVPCNLWRLTPEGETTLANKHMANYLGMNLEDKTQLATVFDTIFHPDDVTAVWDLFSHCLRTGQQFSMKYRLRRADGAYRWMSGRAEPMLDKAGQIVQWFGLCHDIDDQIRAEEALRRTSDDLARATQVASLAELSASIAHEVNQPLTAIASNSDACRRWLTADPPNIERAKATAERIVRDANSAADVVGHIRALFRRAPAARPPEDVNRMIGEVSRLMADKVAAQNCRIEIDLERDLPPVPLDRVQVQQVLVNLIRNGIEAMEATPHRARVLRIAARRDGLDTVRVEVRDPGTGFKDTQRAFDSFFTTKPHGMGMGLAICRSIIESHGGRLWAVNNDTVGATVAFTLPLVSALDTSKTELDS
jgi:PAS domain S-box-containing protein